MLSFTDFRSSRLCVLLTVSLSVFTDAMMSIAHFEHSITHQQITTYNTIISMSRE
ncbi:hypothetical protein AB4K20DRAFT_1917907 [Rhizopus microsporus]